MSHLVTPSVLAADFGNLQQDIEMLNKSKADWIHCDIMDGVFVPNISFGFPVLNCIKKIAKKPMDIHLMIVEPDRHLLEFKEHGAYNITVHYETCNHLHRTIQKIKKMDCKAGVSINPHTNISLLEDIVNEVDLVLVMSVNPGYGGQSFIENSYSRIAKLKDMILKRNSKALIQVDGGVDLSNALKLVNIGVDVLVAGSFVFNSKDQLKTIEDLKNIK